MAFVLDIGGEGRHKEAWNLNPSAVKTLGPNRGAMIHRRIPGKADAIPLPDRSADRIIVERTPLRVTALKEIGRVIKTNGIIVLRHANTTGRDPHRWAIAILPGAVSQRRVDIDGHLLQETTFQLSGASPPKPN